MTAGPVAVVGAGYAGLAAAVELASAGWAPTVFESAKLPGGRARTITLDGRSLDNGQHILVGAYRETLRLLAAVGVRPDQALHRMPLTLAYPDRLQLRAHRLPSPWHLAAGVLCARGLPWSEKLAAIRFVRRMAQTEFRLASDTNVAALLTRERQGPCARQLVWEPLAVAALNTPPARASAQVFLNVLRDTLGGSRGNSDMLIPRVTMSELFPVPAVTWIVRHGGEVRLGTDIAKVEPQARGFKLPPDPRIWQQVILAVGPHQLERLVGDLPHLAESRRLLSAFEYEPILTAYFDYGEQARLPVPMCGSAAGITQWIVDRGQLGASKGLVAAVVSAAGRERRIARAVLQAEIDREIRHALHLAEPPRWGRLVMEKRATFACTPNLQRPDISTPIAGLWLAGDYVKSPYPATLEAAVRSGVECARQVVAQGLGVKPSAADQHGS